MMPSFLPHEVLSELGAGNLLPKLRCPGSHLWRSVNEGRERGEGEWVKEEDEWMGK